MSQRGKGSAFLTKLIRMLASLVDPSRSRPFCCPRGEKERINNNGGKKGAQRGRRRKTGSLVGVRIRKWSERICNTHTGNKNKKMVPRLVLSNKPRGERRTNSPFKQKKGKQLRIDPERGEGDRK